MRCRSCGHQIDANSRFCTFCDCDNYPEMSQVKVKGERPAIKSAEKHYSTTTYTTKQVSKPQSKNSTTNQNSAKGCALCVVVIMMIIFFAILSNIR